jgi:hypothetical protein
LKPFGVVAAHVDGLLPLLRSAPITLVNGVLSDSDRKTGFSESGPSRSWFGRQVSENPTYREVPPSATGTRER